MGAFPPSPELAGIGAVPLKRAKPASVKRRMSPTSTMISAAARGAMPTSVVSVEFALVDELGEFGGGRLVLLEDARAASPRGARSTGAAERPWGRSPRRCRAGGASSPGHSPSSPAGAGRAGPRADRARAHRVHRAAGRGFRERRAGVVPESDPLTDRVRPRRRRLLERSGEAQVRLRLGRDPVGIEPIGLALVTAALRGPRSCAAARRARRIRPRRGTRPAAGRARWRPRCPSDRPARTGPPRPARRHALHGCSGSGRVRARRRASRARSR